MPVTVAHPAAVLPLWRTPLPMAALVTGSMVPDLPLFLRMGGEYAFTHGPWGVFCVDIVIGMAIVALWVLLVRDALVDVSPRWARERVAPRLDWAARDWWLAPAAVCIGAVTHTVWDAFTHPGRWGWRHIEWLRQVHGAFHGYQWAQYASGVLGIATIAVAWAVWLSRQRVREMPARRLPGWALPCAVAAVAVAAVATAALVAGDGLHAVAYNVVVNAISATAVALVALGVLYRADSIAR